jgi:hypothetical protein
MAQGKGSTKRLQLTTVTAALQRNSVAVCTVFKEYTYIYLYNTTLREGKVRLSVRPIMIEGEIYITLNT